MEINKETFCRIKHKSICQNPFYCGNCGKSLFKKKGFYVADVIGESKWFCLKCGEKEKAVEIKPADYWVLAIKIQRLLFGEND